MIAIPDAFVERSEALVTIENHLVAADLAGFFGDVADDGGADAAPLELLMDRNVFDVADQSAMMNELAFDQQRCRTDDAVVDFGDISAIAGAQPGLKDLERLVVSHVGFGKAGQSFEEAFFEVGRAEFSNYYIGSF